MTDLTPNRIRPGAIVLARHGEPALSRKVLLNAEGYRAFWAQYEVGGILPGQTPPDRLKRFVTDCGTLVTSTRLRAIQSAQTVVGDRAFDRHEFLIEAPLPPPRFPGWVRFSPRIWRKSPRNAKMISKWPSRNSEPLERFEIFVNFPHAIEHGRIVARGNI